MYWLQLQYLVTDESCQECVELLQQEQRRGGAGGLCNTAHQRASAEIAYQRRSEQALADENCFKMYVVSTLFPLDVRAMTFLNCNKQINMEGGQSSTYPKLTRALSGPQVSVAKTYRDENETKMNILAQTQRPSLAVEYCSSVPLPCLFVSCLSRFSLLHYIRNKKIRNKI